MFISCTDSALGLAEGLSVPLRALDGYRILQVSTGKAADLVQAWSMPLTAQGELVALDSKSKSKFCCIASPDRSAVCLDDLL